MELLRPGTSVRSPHPASATNPAASLVRRCGGWERNSDNSTRMVRAERRRFGIAEGVGESRMPAFSPKAVIHKDAAPAEDEYRGGRAREPHRRAGRPPH